MVADDLDRIHVFALGANLEDSTLWVPHGHGIGISITDLQVDPARREVVERERLTAESDYIGPPVTVRPDGEGGLLEVNHRTVTRDGPSYIEARRTIPESLCRNGVVGRPAFDRRTLTLNGSDGDEEHVATVPAGTPVALGILGQGDGEPPPRDARDLPGLPVGSDLQERILDDQRRHSRDRVGKRGARPAQPKSFAHPAGNR